jgi:hypothetical protein
LRKIIINHFQQDVSPLFEVALTKFVELRDDIYWRKKPSTGEFINWLRLLERGLPNNITQEYEEIRAEVLRETKLYQLPFLHTLVKNQSDQNTIEKLKND